MKLNKRISKIFSSQKGTYLGMVILIMLSVSCYIGFKTASLCIIETVESNRNSSILEDANFTLMSPLNEEAINKYEEDFSLILENKPTIDVPHGYMQATLRLLPEGKKLNLPTLHEGKYLENPNDIMVDRYFLTAQKLNLGDSLKIYGKEYNICGVFTIPDYIVVTRLDTDFMADGSKFGMVMVSQQEFDLLPKDKCTLSYSVKFNNNNEEAFRKALGKDNYVLSWEPKGTNYRISTFDGESKSILTLSIIAPLFLLIVSTIILSVVLSRMIKKEYIYIGTLTALGYKKRQIISHYLQLPIIISIAGSCLGIILGNFLIKPFSFIISMEYNIPKTIYKINPWDIIFILLLPIVLNIIAITLTVAKALHISIINLLKGDPAKNKSGLLTKLIPYKKGSFKIRFKLKEILANILRSVLMLIGISTASMFMITGFLFYNSMDFLFESNFNTLFGYKYQYVYNTLQTERATKGEPYMMASYYYKKDNSVVNFTLN